MYNAEYYKGKKDKVLRKIQISKDNFLQRQIDETNRFLGDQKGFQEDLNEITTEENESKKPKPKKDVKRK